VLLSSRRTFFSRQLFSCKECHAGSTGRSLRARRRISSPFDTAIFPPCCVARRSGSYGYLPASCLAWRKPACRPAGIARLKQGIYFSPAPKPTDNNFRYRPIGTVTVKPNLYRAPAIERSKATVAFDELNLWVNPDYA